MKLLYVELVRDCKVDRFYWNIYSTDDGYYVGHGVVMVIVVAAARAAKIDDLVK